MHYSVLSEIIQIYFIWNEKEEKSCLFQKIYIYFCCLLYFIP